MAMRSSKLGSSRLPAKSGVSFAQSGIGQSKPYGASPGSVKKTTNIQSTTEFSKHLQSLQKHAEENVEDEYIKNLQQQIAYMELELKLLKEKEMEQKASVSQIDRFFNDGVPLNENILAMKNQYNATKKDFESQIDDNNQHRLEEEKTQRDLKFHYEMLNARLSDMLEDDKQKRAHHEKELREISFAYINEKHVRSGMDKELKELKEQHKKLYDENLRIERDIDKRKMMAPNKRERNENIRAKTKRELAAKDEQIVKLEGELEEIKHKAEFNPMVNILEDENKQLHEKIISSERQIGLAQSKVKEMRMLLEQRAREREREGDQRRELNEKIENLKTEIEKQNKVNELVIEQKVKEKEQKEIRDISKQIQETHKLQNMMKERIRTATESIDTMSGDKVTMQQEFLDQEQQDYRLTKELKDLQEKVLEYKNKIEDFKLRLRHLEPEVAQTETDVRKTDALIPRIEDENDRLKGQIEHLNKQVELSQQIKALNLEDLRILKNTNDQVFNTLSEMTKKWEILQRFSQMAEGMPQ